MDRIVAGIAKSGSYTPSMYGTFDFDELADSTQTTQKQRRERRKLDPTTEKRPTTVTTTSKSENQCSKVEIVFNTIKEVRNITNYFIFIIAEIQYFCDCFYI